MRYAVFWKWSALYDEVSKLADGSGIVGIVVSPDNLRRDAGFAACRMVSFPSRSGLFSLARGWWRRLPLPAQLARGRENDRRIDLCCCERPEPLWRPVVGTIMSVVAARFALLLSATKLALTSEPDREREAIGGMDRDRDLERRACRVEIMADNPQGRRACLGFQGFGQPLGHQHRLDILTDLGNPPAIPRTR